MKIHLFDWANLYCVLLALNTINFNHNVIWCYPYEFILRFPFKVMMKDVNVFSCEITTCDKRKLKMYFD